MKLTIKLLLALVITASTIFADGDMNNGGDSPEGDMNNGGRTCTINCPEPSPSPQNSGTNTQTDEETDDDSVLTFIENYLKSLFR